MKKIDKIINTKEEKLKPLYLIYGEEDFLLNEFQNKFINNFVSEQMKDFNLTFLDDDSDEFVNRLINSVKTLPVMTEKRYVVARCQQYFCKKSKQDDRLIHLFDNFPQSTILLLVIKGNIDGRIKINREVKKMGEIIELTPPRYQNLDNWIKNEFKQQGKKIDNKSIKFLEHMFNNKLQQLETEIAKIVTYCSDKQTINFNDVKNVISKDRLLRDNIIFSFVDALSKKNKKKALVLLNEMINAGEFSLRIMGMISRQLRLLLSVKELKNKGKYPDEIADIINEHPYPVKKCFNACDNYTAEELEKIMERFLDANYDIVTGKYDDNKMALEMALFDI